MLSKNTSFSVGEHFSSFIAAQIDSGRYASASDVVRAGLRRLEEDEHKLTALRAALIEGEKSGDPKPLDINQFIQEMKLESEQKN